MTLPATVPTVKVYKGDTYTASYVFKTKSADTPINLVDDGWETWIAQWRPSSSSTEYVAFVVDDTYAHQGRIIITAPPALTRLIKNGVWDLQSTRGTEVKTWVRGRVEGIGDVTRATN